MATSSSSLPAVDAMKDTVSSSLLEQRALDIYETLSDAERKRYAIFGIMYCMRCALVVIQTLMPRKGGDL